MKKFGLVVVGLGIIGFIVKYFWFAIIVLGIILCIVLIHKAVINHSPKINTKLKWGGKL